MGWRNAALCTMVMYGFWMFFASKSTPVYGAKVSCFMQMMGYVVLLAVMGFGRADIAKITRPALMYGVIATALAVGGTYALFYAVGIAPKQAAVITVIAEGYPLITALLIHFMVQPLLPRQWVGIFLMVGGMVLVNLRDR